MIYSEHYSRCGRIIYYAHYNFYDGHYLLLGQGKYAEAHSLYARAISFGEKRLGPAHPDLAIWLGNKAALYQAQVRVGRVLEVLMLELPHLCGDVVFRNCGAISSKHHIQHKLSAIVWKLEPTILFSYRGKSRRQSPCSPGPRVSSRKFTMDAIITTWQQRSAIERHCWLKR